MAEPKDTPRVISCRHKSQQINDKKDQYSAAYIYIYIYCMCVLLNYMEYHLVLESKYDGTGMLCCVPNDGKQDDANEAH